MLSLNGNQLLWSVAWPLYPFPGVIGFSIYSQCPYQETLLLHLCPKKTSMLHLNLMLYKRCTSGRREPLMSEGSYADWTTHMSFSYMHHWSQRIFEVSAWQFMWTSRIGCQVTVDITSQWKVLLPSITAMDMMNLNWTEIAIFGNMFNWNQFPENYIGIFCNM